MKLISFIYNLVLNIVDIRAWIRVGEYNKDWDKKLNSLLDQYIFVYKTECTAFLGPYQIWIDNYPYGSFSLYNSIYKFLPSRSTVRRAMKKLKKDLRNQPSYLEKEMQRLENKDIA